MQNQQSDGSTRFPHGTEVRFDCLRTAVEEVDPISTVGEEPTEDEDYIEDVEYGEEVSDYEEDNAEYVEGETEIGAVEYDYRKKRAIRQKTNKRKKQKNRNSSRRRNQMGTLDEDEHDSYGGSNQVAKGEKKNSLCDCAWGGRACWWVWNTLVLKASVSQFHFCLNFIFF